MKNGILLLAICFAICCVMGGRCSMGAERQRALTAVKQTGGAFPQPPFDIPRMDKTTIDGDAAGWGEGGLRVDAFVGHDATVVPEDRFSARMRLGWNDKGLLVLLQIREAHFSESAFDDDLGLGTCVEFFMLDRRGGSELIKASVSPGMDPAHPELRYTIEDFRTDATLCKLTPTLKAARRKQQGGYSMEVLLPWENVGIKPQVGTELAFQVWINDYAEGGPPLHAVWYPASGIHGDPAEAQRHDLYPDGAGPNIRLALTPSPPVRVAGRAWYDGLRNTPVAVVADAESAGKEVSVLAEGKEIVHGVLTREGSRALVRLTAPLPPIGGEWKSVTILLDGKPVDSVPLPDLAKHRAEAAAELEFAFESFCFAGKTFPSGDFQNPLEARNVIGPYAVKATCYDAQFNPVASAEKPGRYGAMVEVTPEKGPEFKRFFTLFRTAGDMQWRGSDVPAGVVLPDEAGLDPAVVREQGRLLSDFAVQRMADGFRGSEEGAILLAWLREAKPGQVATDRTGPESIAERWVHELKRRTGNVTPLQYYVRMPVGADRGEAKKWPTIIFLHGAGDRGRSVAGLAFNAIVKYARSKPDFPFIVIAPRCPADGWWDALVPELEDCLDEVIAKYPVDTEHIYLTGLSMGGYASWRLAAEHPDLFAASVPLCGGGDPADVERIKDLPIWNFHGAKDQRVPFRLSCEMIEALRKVHGRVRFTVYAEAGHNCWGRAYNTDALYSWMLAQSRGKPAEPQTTLTGSVPTETLP